MGGQLQRRRGLLWYLLKCRTAKASKAKEIFHDIGDTRSEAFVMALQAQVCRIRGDLEEAINVATQALELARKAKDGEVEHFVVDLINAVSEPVAQPEMMVGQALALPEAGREGSMAEASPAGLDPEIVRPKVLEIVKNVTGGDEEIFLDTPLADTGMDSLTAVSFRNELMRTFQGIHLPASLMFDYPNIMQTTDHIVELSKAIS